MMNSNDKSILRELARKQLELSQSNRNKSLYKDWLLHGDLKADSRPLIRIELWTFEQDILPSLMKCEDEYARSIEKSLLTPIVNFEMFGDDTLVPDHISYHTPMWFTPFGIDVKKQETGGLGHHFISVLSDLSEDFHKLGKSTYGISREQGQKDREIKEELFGDIMPVKPARFSLVSTPTQDIVHIMSMEDMYVAMYDEPELFHKMMDMLSSDYIEYFRFLEREGVLMSANSDYHLCQGSYCFTNELPEKDGASLKDMWLFMDSQETSGISPEMYEEFVFPYYKRVMDIFGRVSYGCCEATHPIWDKCLSKVDNMRKVSVSPWCDEEFMGNALQDRRAVYLRKPSPNFLGVGDKLNEEAVREHFAKTAKLASGCKLELAQRDVYHVSDADAVKRYVEIAHEELKKYEPRRTI